MMSELFLIRRIGLAALLGYLLISFTGVGSTLHVVQVTVLSVVQSFLWQYFVLHFALKTMQPRTRVAALIGWFTVSMLVMAIGLILLYNLDWNQGETLLMDFAKRATVYIVGAGMWVGGSCTRRAFQIHGGLNLPKHG